MSKRFDKLVSLIQLTAKETPCRLETEIKRMCALGTDLDGEQGEQYKCFHCVLIQFAFVYKVRIDIKVGQSNNKINGAVNVMFLFNNY